MRKVFKLIQLCKKDDFPCFKLGYSSKTSITLGALLSIHTLRMLWVASINSLSWLIFGFFSISLTSWSLKISSSHSFWYRSCSSSSFLLLGGGALFSSLLKASPVVPPSPIQDSPTLDWSLFSHFSSRRRFLNFVRSLFLHEPCHELVSMHALIMISLCLRGRRFKVHSIRYEDIYI